MALALLLVVLVLCILLVALILHFLLKPLICKRKRVKLRDLPNGSLIFTCHIGRRYMMHIAAINTNHVATLVKDGNKIYFVEHSHVRGKDVRDCHARLVDAKEYLADNRIYVMTRKYTGPPISFNRVRLAMDRLSHHHIYMNYSNDFMYHHYSLTKDLRDPSTTGISCAEYAYKLQCELGLSTLNARTFTDAYRHLENDCLLYDELTDLIL